MPPASPSPEFPRPRCTSVHSPVVISEEGFSVRRVGSVVALHFETVTGRYTYHLDEACFVRKARGEKDDQLNPFRTLEQIQAARDSGKSEDRVEVIRFEPAKKKLSPNDRRRASKISEARRQLYLAAYVHAHTWLGGNMKASARKHGVPYHALRGWCQLHQDACHAALEAARPPILKPKGSLL